MRRGVSISLLISLVALLLIVSPALATGPGMVADVNPSSPMDEAYIEDIANMGAYMLLLVSEGNHGMKLWSMPASSVYTFVPMTRAK
ncbi:MAG: hypothetical protein ACYC5O_02465 [Anaerolineae bacterium]